MRRTGNARETTPATLTRDPADSDYSATGAIGDPTLATAEKAEAILAAMPSERIEGLRLLFRDALGDGDNEAADERPR